MCGFIGTGGVSYRFMINGTESQCSAPPLSLLALSNSDDPVEVYDSTTQASAFPIFRSIEVFIDPQPVAHFLQVRPMIPVRVTM